ncbi:MAG: hypothetical protein OEU93_18950, partial [Rubrivivax sp.]|nr:hypothetical protein [Rubrivivax sp.]
MCLDGAPLIAKPAESPLGSTIDGTPGAASLRCLRCPSWRTATDDRHHRPMADIEHHARAPAPELLTGGSIAYACMWR